MNALSFTNGKFFKVVFIKRDGTERKMVARIGVKKFLQGGERKNPHIIVWEVGNGYRSIIPESIKEIKCGKVHVVKM